MDEIREVFIEHGVELTEEQFLIEYQKLTNFAEASFKIVMKGVEEI